MAVCGRCWICDAKFECVELESCGDCTDHKPLRTYRDGVYGYKICGHCEKAVESGAIGSIVHAIRALKEP